MPTAPKAETAENAAPQPLRRGNETDLTYRLKWTAWEWLYREAGCRAIGFEVRLEGPFGRVADLVGLGPDNAVYVVEVKSSRADMRRDDHTEHDVSRLGEASLAMEEASNLTRAILEQTEEHARSINPDGWEEAPAVKQARTEHRRVTERKEALARRMETFSTKFHDPAFLRCADYHYLMAPSGLLRPPEMPPYWGLLDDAGATVVEAPPKQVRRVTRNVLRAIARANTRDLMKACGVEAAAEPGG